MKRYLTLLPAALAVLALADATPALAQPTADDLFDPNTLHEIRLTLNTRDLRDLRGRYLENTYYQTEVQWRNIRVRNAGVRSRGNASRSDVKLGLRVDFNRYVTGQKFLGLKSFVLKNLWQDPSMMHEKLAMALFARMGHPAPRESFCRLYINNEFQGLYVIVESVDDAFLTRNFGESKGYLHSYQLQSVFQGEYLGEDLAAYKDRFEAQNHEKEADTKLYLPIHDWLREVNHPVDGVWRDRVEEYVDLAQFVTQVALEIFVAENDGLLGATGMNNFFIYREDGSKRHRFIPWDKDSSFLFWDVPIFQRADENILFRRAFAYSDLRDRYYEVLESVARSAAEDGWLEAEVERAAELITATVEADSRKPFSTDEYFEAVEAMKRFAQKRSKFVLDEVAAARRRR